MLMQKQFKKLAPNVTKIPGRTLEIGAKKVVRQYLEIIWELYVLSQVVSTFVIVVTVFSL